MNFSCWRPKRIVFAAAIAALLFISPGLPRVACGQPESSMAEPWTPQQVVQPAELAKELARAPGERPMIVFVGFRTLFEGGHIPGALMHGPVNTAQSLAAFKSWAKSLDRSANIVIYCGCCPFVHCPNVRPAFEALKSMGFKQLRVLKIENNLAADWVEHGYPTQKGP